MTTSISLVNVGTTANDGTGDTIRSAFQTVNNNFSYLTSYTITTATNSSVLYANTGARKFVANGVGTLSNVWINLPSTSADGQEMLITSLVPITSCFVNQSGQPILWLSNNFFASGNVTARLTYTTTNNRWMTF
jgi:hypothetical protein